METDNYYPLRGNGFYYRQAIEYCQSIGVEFRIKYELIPSFTLPADYFHELKDLVYDNCKNAKNVFNAMIGCFNRRKLKPSKDRFTTDVNDAIRYYFSDQDSTYSNPQGHPIYFISSHNHTSCYTRQ